MSCSYADGLSPYHDKGKLGLAEKFDELEEVRKKVKVLAKWINESKHVVVHTGAGISTSAGIPDFRGPKGVWTLEEKGEKPSFNVSFNEAIPTKTHMALKRLADVGKIKFVISQNIDGLHLRSGLGRKYLAELHGNMFVEQCHVCHRQFVRSSATTSVGQKCLEKICPESKPNGRPCRGKLHDVILDWEHNLPEKDLGLADFHSCVSDLSICLGTTLQIVPSGNLPLNAKKYNAGKLVICNLQPTKHDKKADLLIHSYIDDIMTLLMKELDLDVPEYSSEFDLSNSPTIKKGLPVEWTITDCEVKRMRFLYEKNCCKPSKKKSTKKIEEEDCERVKVKREGPHDGKSPRCQIKKAKVFANCNKSVPDHCPSVDDLSSIKCEPNDSENDRTSDTTAENKDGCVEEKSDLYSNGCSEASEEPNEKLTQAERDEDISFETSSKSNSIKVEDCNSKNSSATDEDESRLSSITSNTTKEID